jgi:hypothetical protein
LVATDGNLSKKPGRIAIISKDSELLDTVRRCLCLTALIGPHTGGFVGSHCYRLAWSDREFYDWLLGIGLTPAKSLTLGPLVVPDEYFADFFRGCLDGDGSVVTYIDRYNTSKHPGYVYTRLYVSIVSASPPFLEWLRESLRRMRGVLGSLSVNHSPGRNDMWRLRYAKRESLALLRWRYYTPAVPCLGRKRATAAPFLTVPARPAARRPGRPVVP